MIACRLAKNFESPDKFIPERWISRNSQIHPYLVLPFGHGMRACIARRLAEQNILVLLLRVDPFSGSSILNNLMILEISISVGSQI